MSSPRCSRGSSGPSPAEAGLVTAAFGFARLCCDLPAGYLADRIGHRRALLLGVLGITAGCLASAAAPSLLFLLAARALVGVGHAFVSIGSLGLLLRASPARARGRTTNWMEITAVSGFTAGSLLGGLVGAAFGWRGAFLATAAPALLGGVLLAATLPPRGREGASWGATPPAEPAQAAPTPPRPRVLGLSVAPFLANLHAGRGMGGNPLHPLPPLRGPRPRAPGRRDRPGAQPGLLADLLGLTVAGWAADRLGRLAVLLPALGCLALGSGLLPYTRSAVGYVLVGMLLGVVFAAWMMPRSCSPNGCRAASPGAAWAGTGSSWTRGSWRVPSGAWALVDAEGRPRGGDGRDGARGGDAARRSGRRDRADA